MISAPRCEELTSNFGVPRDAGGLVDDLIVPGEAEPVEPVDDCGDRLRCRPQAVGIFDAQQEFAAVVPRRRE